MENITKEKLQEMLTKIKNATNLQKETLEKCAVSQKDLDKVKSNTLIEITRLQGEERAVKFLLSELEPPKETGKKL